MSLDPGSKAVLRPSRASSALEVVPKSERSEMSDPRR